MSIARTPSPELAQKILTDVQRYSQPFGTKIEIVGGVGVIKVDSTATATLTTVVKRGGH